MRSDEHEAIWASLPGAQAVRDLYGYWPTMHDAHVVRVEVDGAARTVTLHLYYYDDGPEGAADKDEVHSLIVLRFTGVVSFRHRFTDNWLDDLTFARKGDLIEAALVDSDSGIRGALLARS